MFARKFVLTGHSGGFDLQSAKIEEAGWSLERFQLSGSPGAKLRVLELSVRAPMQAGLTEARLTLDIKATGGETVRIVVPIVAVVTRPAVGGESDGER